MELKLKAKKSRIARKFRWLQFITFVHRVHHVHFSYGWIMPGINIGYFRNFGLKKVAREHFHNCTTTGVY